MAVDVVNNGNALPEERKRKSPNGQFIYDSLSFECSKGVLYENIENEPKIERMRGGSSSS